MKGKIITYSLFLVLSIGLGLSLFLAYKAPTSQSRETSFESEEIIAPAIIDSLNDIIRIPTLQSALVTKIHVRVGQMVKKGQILLSLDDTLAKHNVTVSQIGLKQSQNNLLVNNKNLKRAMEQFERLNSLDKRAISQSELRDKIHEIKMAKIQLKQARYNLDLAKANLKNAKTALNQFSILAPKDGIILQINAHQDEFVGGAHQVIYLGDAHNVIVRVSIDERDIKNFTSKASAYLTNNENDQLKVGLKFIQLDRYIITHERLNSRVQEALYSFKRDVYPSLVAGQQFDAHITFKHA